MPKSSEAKHKELADVERQIVERKRYLREQEAVIAEAIETGNGKIMELRHDVLVSTKQLRDLKTEIRSAKLDRKLLEEELKELRDAIGGILQPGIANAAG